MIKRPLLLVQASCLLSTLLLPLTSHGQIAVYQADTAGESLASGGGDLTHSFDNTIRGGSSEHTLSTSTDITMATGHHLVIYNTRFDSTGGGQRSEIIGKLNLDGADLPAGWSQSYMRRQEGNDEAINSGGAIIEVNSPGDILQLRSLRTDTNTGDGLTRVAGENAIQLIKLDDAWPYIRLVGGVGTQPLAGGGSSWDEVTYDTELEKDTGFTFTAGTSDITLDAAGHYLIMANSYLEMTPNGNRDGCVQRVTLDGSEVSGSRTTTYIRGQADGNGTFTGVTATGMIIEATAGQVLNIEIQQRGTQDINITEDKTALSIVKLPDGVDYIRLEDLLSKQNLNPTTLTALNYDDAGSQIEVDSAFSHSVSTNPSRVTVNAAGDYLFLSTQYADPEVQQRVFYNQGWQVNGGGMLGYGQTGNYARNATVEACGNWSGFVSGLNASDYIETVSVELGKSGSLDAVLSLQGIKLDSLFGPDTDPPEITPVTPPDDSSGIYVKTDLIATFNEDVALTGVGTVTIKNLDDGSGASDITYDLSTATEVTLVNNELVINPASNLASGTNFAVRISNDAVEDQATSPNAFPGILDDTTWNFTTVAPDGTPPVLTGKNPADDSIDQSAGTTIVATFDEDIVLSGSGTIDIIDLTDGLSSISINLSGPDPDAGVSVLGNVLTIDPTGSFEFGKSYAVQISNDAITNFNDEAYLGIADNTTWNFTIISDVTVVYEPFDYPVGSLNGAGGTTEVGLSGTWNATTATLIEDSLYSTVARSGGSIAYASGGSNNFGGAREVDPAALAGNGLLSDGATLYFSMDLGYDTGGNVTNSRLGVFLGTESLNTNNFRYHMNTAGATGLGVTLGRFGVNGKVVATQVRDSSFGTSGFSGNLFGSEVGSQFSAGEHGVIVGKLIWGATPGDDETLELYRIDPADPTNEAAATLLSILTVSGVDQTEYDTITWARGDKVVLDEIRFGTTWSSVTPPDVTDPLLVAVSPTGAGDPPNGDDSLWQATFDEPVESVTSPTGNIIFRNAGDDTVYTTIAPDDATQISYSGKNVNITPTLLPIPGNSYYIEIEPGALQDPAGNPYVGYTGSGTWDFTTDSTPPVATITDNSVNGEIFFSTQQLIYTLSFDEVITTSAGISDFELIGTATASIDSVTQTSDTTIEVVVTATGVGTINLNVKASASFLDGVGNSLDGPFADAETITVLDISLLSNQLGILDLTANNGVNPATGNLWKAGDPYRLMFTSLAKTTATSNDIATYNSFIQGVANGSSLGLGGVTWKALVSAAGDGGSIAAVDARDNTNTNPTVEADGGAIFLLNGTEHFATSNTDLWDGSNITQPDTDEEGALVPTSGAGSTSIWTSWYGVWTGTSGNGTAKNALGNGGNTNLGLSREGTGVSSWIDRGTNDPSIQLGMYAISETLTVSGPGGPSLVSITDSVSGQPVTVGDSVSYTVTFDTAMDAGTIGTDDFENSSSAGITVDSVVVTGDPAVFTVGVTTTSTGDLNLQIKAGTAISDGGASPLDTTLPIPDDTTILVRSIYDTWAADNGLSGGEEAPGSNTDGDAFTQLEEFAYGTNPGASDSGALTVTDGSTFTPGGPVVEQIFSGGNPIKLRYVRRKDHAAAGITYTPKFSDSLSVFQPDADDPVPVVVSDAGGDYEVVEVPFPLFDSSGHKAASLFGVVEVTQNP